MHGAATTQLKSGGKDNPGGTTRYARGNEQQRCILGGSAFQLCGRFNSFPTKLYYQCSKVSSRHPSSLRRAGNGSSWLDRGSSGVHPVNKTISATLTAGFNNCHSSSCLLARHDGVIGATIWHALLPSSCLFVDSARTLMRAGSTNSALTSVGRKFCGTAAFIDGSWNAAGDVRPARWLHNSTWLLFGFCACFAAAASAPALTVACCEANPSTFASVESGGETEVQVDATESHGKKVYKDFSVIGIPGDGRCLFRAVAHGVCTKQGKPTSNEDSQRELADDLRNQVVDELIKRRSESEWFIEGDFDQYTDRMREPHVWGGEPELLMLAHVLKQPITVYMSDRSSDGLIAIAEYGQEYGKEDPIRVLYHGFGHYDALQIPAGEAAAHSRL